MIPDELKDALATLTKHLGTSAEVDEQLRSHWRYGRNKELDDRLREAASALSEHLPTLTHTAEGLEILDPLFESEHTETLLAWCSASAWRRDTWIAPLLGMVPAAHGEEVVGVARERIVAGPLHDALSCVPFLGDGHDLLDPINAEAHARLEILVWEAGASALEMPELGRWIYSSQRTFRVMVSEPALGNLRGRVLAARCLEVSVCGMPPTVDQELVGWTLEVLQPLLLHPEPLVWVHAARAIGRLTGNLQQLEGMLLDWMLGDSPVLRQRAICAFASLPAERLGFMASQLQAIIKDADEDAWVLAAVAAATPYLYVERPDIWHEVARRILDGEGGAITARALAKGLATLWRRGPYDHEVEQWLQELRDVARRPSSGDFGDLRRYIEVLASTDVVDGAERDPLDLELGLDNLMRVAAQYDDEEADARAARFATMLGTTFQDARKIVLTTRRPRHRAAAVNALEGCGRAFALRLWRPLLDTSPARDALDEPDLTETWKVLSTAPSELLDIVRERRQTEGRNLDEDLPLEVLALRLGGYALDACSDAAEDRDRGPTAHDTCLWLRKLEGLADGSRAVPEPLERALSAIFWRLVDTTRGTTLGLIDDVQWLGPFAAWWALVIDRPAMLHSLGNALPMMAAGALTHCCEQAEALRRAVSSGAPEGQWGPEAAQALASLKAGDTELAHALQGLSEALAKFSAAAGLRPNLEAMCVQLVLAGDRLQQALADPVKALRPAEELKDAEDSLTKASTQNAPRVASLVARAISVREMALIDVWLASLGPATSALLEDAIRAAIRRTPPPPKRKKPEGPKVISGYELIKPLGAGGIGSVWLVRKPGADRMFVLKIPKADVLQSATEVEREGILSSFVEEAAALAGLYHPNVANIIDRGVAEGVPFLVLEYLIGADLKMYSVARRMTLFELSKVVQESCAGLAALHGAGLVHRDIKPANLWLRLPLAGGVKFDPHKHRDPAVATPLSTVVIDFGMVRASKVDADAGGRFVAGTAGYIAPEQVLDPVELDVRADVYALAATIYNVTTGRAFFDDIENHRDRIIAHMRRDPFEDQERLKSFPASVAKLLRAATAKNPKHRPMPIEFGRAFSEAL